MTSVFETPGAVRLLVQLPAGRVEIESGTSGETSVELSPLKDNDVTRRAIDEAVVEHRQGPSGDEVRVEIEPERRLFLGRTPQVLVRVTCPSGTAVDLTAVAADVRASGQFGTVDAKNVSGDTAFDEIGGEARIKAVSGDIAVGRVAGTAQFETVSGDLRVDEVTGDCTIKTVSGDFGIGEARSSVTGKSVSGDGAVEAVSAGSVSFRSVSGDLRIGVRPGAGVWMDVNSRSGDVRSELDAGEGGEDEATVEIRATTLSGDITITRAAVATPVSSEAQAG